MAHRVYTQGEQHMLNVYFQGVAFTGPFYIGLGTGPIPPDESDTLADVTEVVGTNYARQSIDRAGAPSGWTVSGDQAQGAEVEWENLDPSDCWTPADYAFLTLSPDGTTNPNILIAAVDLTTPTILEPGKTLSLLFRFRQL